jgi:hypothetical protein
LLTEAWLSSHSVVFRFIGDMGRNDNHKRDFAGWTAKQFTWAMLCGHNPQSGPAAPIGDHSDSIAICNRHRVPGGADDR